MDARELRIGNWVHLKDKKNYQISRGYDIEKIEDWYGTDYCTGIPITEEILLKAGFVWEDHGLRKKSFCIRQYGSGFALFLANESLNFMLRLDYVHTLQNFFSSIGEELEINLQHDNRASDLSENEQNERT